MAANANARSTLERISDREIVVTRMFRAAPKIVFEAWTRPELVQRWWAPKSRGVEVKSCTAEVRPGGAYRYVLGGRAHGEMAFFGDYREISRPGKLVYTQRFEPVIGQPLPGEAIITVTFAAVGENNTLLSSSELYPSKDVLDGVLASGMEDGMRETFDQCDALVASLQAGGSLLEQGA